MADDDLEVDDLVHAALALDDDDPDEDEHYAVLVAELQHRGSRETFEAMRALIEDGDENAQMLGAAVLGQLGYTEGRPFGGESVLLVAPLATGRGSVDLVTTAVGALGLIGERAGAAAVLAQARHADEQVRLAVAQSLPGIAGSPADPAVVEALLGLMEDPSGPVRDWATFAFGSEIDADTPAIRAALLARIGDKEGAWDEALAGLARRGHPETARLVEQRLGERDLELDPLVAQALVAAGYDVAPR